MEYKSYTDQDILELLKTDGSRAIELIFKKYYKDLCIVSNRYIKDLNQTEDLVQELLYDIWNRRQDININSSLSSYLRKSVVNRSLNYLRGKKIKLDDEEKMQFKENDESSAQQNLEGKELEDYINSSIDQLPEKCRLIFIMSRFDQMSYKEIAENLDISTKTVENQICKALKHLREALDIRNKYI